MRTAFIGRFQPFHKGHLHAVEQFEEDNIIIVIADGETRTEENPLEAEERREIIQECMDSETVVQQNHPGDDEKWARELLGKTDAERVVTGNERTRDAIQNNTEVKVVEQEMLQPDLYSGTEIRRRIRSGEEWRYLVPDCAEEKTSQYLEVIKETGIQYDFKPGWKKQNAYHGTAEE